MKKHFKNSTLSQQLKHEWGELDLACKAIFIIGTLLVIQLFYSIFCPLAFISSSVDSIFRTSLSSIFGYILGMNLPHPATKQPSSSLTETKKQEDPILKKEKPFFMAINIRVMFAMLICISSMLVLIVASYTHQINHTEGISQIGYLISTTIGFLISSSSHHH